jgi:hypothetical protein
LSDLVDDELAGDDVSGDAERRGDEVTGAELVVAEGVTASLDRVDVPVDVPVDEPAVGRSVSDDGKVVQSGRVPDDRRTASAAARDDDEPVEPAAGFDVEADAADDVAVMDVDFVVLDDDDRGAGVGVEGGVVGVRRAGGPSRSDDFPAGRASGRARGGRGEAGRTAGCRVGAR